MHLNCPHCHNPIEVVSPDQHDVVVCPSCGSSFRLEEDRTSQRMTTEYHRQLGRFTLVDKVGMGAFGAVYKARDPQLDRIVAIKIPRAGNLLDGHDKERFLREARSVAQLRHPSIVSVYEVGEADEFPYIVSDFVEGVTLADYVTARRPRFKESAELIAQVAAALEYAHRMGVVHRDVKPSNIMLEIVSGQSPVVSGQEATVQRTTDNGQPTPRLMDFGLAKRDAGEITMTVDGQVLGTPAYMSPEQARGEGHKVDGRSDVYSLGVILYELLTGELPFRGNTRMLLHQVLHDEPRSPRSMNDRIPRDLETICLKAMTKEPGRRYQSACDFAGDLNHWLKGEPIQARPVGQLERFTRWCRRNPTVAVLTAGIAAVLLAGAIVSTIFALIADQRANDLNTANTNLENANTELTTEKGKLSDALGLADQRADERLAAVEQFQIANGLRDADAGQLYQALRWFALPLAGEGSRKPRAEMYRDRLSNYWRHSQAVTSTGYVLVLQRQAFADTRMHHGGSVSPDGRRAVTIDTTGTNNAIARIMDVASGQAMGPPLQHQGEVLFGAFSPDGSLVVTGSRDGTARFWDAATGLPVGPPLMHQGHVWHARFSRDGKRVVTASLDFTARIWDTASRHPVGPPLQHQAEVLDAAFSPDGRCVVTASYDKTARVWDATTGQRIGHALQHQARVVHAAFSPDGRHILTGSDDQTERMWDAAIGQPTEPPLGHQHIVVHAAFSADGRWVVTCSSDRTARLWDAATGQLAAPPLQHQDYVNHAAFSPDGRQVVTAAGGFVRRGEARIWNTTTGKPIGPPLQHRDIVNYAAFSPDGRRIVTASQDKTAKVWDATTGLSIGKPLEHQSGVKRAEFSADASRIVTASEDMTARIWDAVSGQSVGAPLQHQNHVNHAAFSPDGRRVVTASWDETAQVWDAVTGKSIGKPLRHHGIVWHAEFSSGGDRILTASHDNTARVWETVTGQPLAAALQHLNYVRHAAFSPDGRRVVTASDDRTARVWDAATGQPIGPPLQHQGHVWHAAFSPDGRRVVTASTDKTARVWDVSTDDRPAEDWVRLTQFLAGEMDRFGAKTPMRAEKMQSEWAYLKAKYPQDFTVTPAQALAWHRREAEACQKEQNPAAALFHTLYGCDLNWAVPLSLGHP